MGKHPAESQRSDHANDPHAVSESDIAAWAERERKRRQAWLEGPNEEEKKAWARAERRRRMREHDDESADADIEADIAEGQRLADRFQRDASLALAGVASRLFESPYRMLGTLIREGREWENDRDQPVRRRRRVPLHDDED